MAAMNPLFARISPEYQEEYNVFFEKTSRVNIADSVSDLGSLVELAEKVHYVLGHANPIWDTWGNQWGDQARGIEARQWELNQLSSVKQRLAQAIQYKKEYYENTWMGWITKLFLKLFGMWNRGNTAAIKRGEDFLLRFDSRRPVLAKPGEPYRACYFWPLIDHNWVNEHLNTANFYNYEPTTRAIEVIDVRNEAIPRFMVAVI